MFIAGCCSSDDDKPIVIADFTHTENGLSATFNDVSIAFNSFIMFRTWEFGDGNTSTDANPVHTYATAGTYSVTLMLVDSFGLPYFVVKNVTVPSVDSANVIPNFKFVANDLSVTFTDATTIKSGTITSYSWNFGDNSQISNDVNPAHTYAAAGTYSVTLTLVDSSGLSYFVVKNVKVPSAGGANVFKTIAAGTYFSLRIMDNNKTYSWGGNASGQLGNGTTGTGTRVPTLVTMPAGVTFTQIEAGASYSLALSDDGNAYSWGAGGALGDGTSEMGKDKNVPTLVTMPAGVTFTQIIAGYYHSLAIGSDNKTYAWGDNFRGQLGDGTSADKYVPTLVTMPEGVTFTQVAAGADYSLAIGDDNKTYAWGINEAGELGNGANNDSSVPTLVTMPAGVTFTQISAGREHSLALGSDGKAYAWGAGYSGELGNGSVGGSNVPTLVTMPTGVTFTQIEAGVGCSFAIGSDGNVYSWGNNVYGQLGNGSKVDSSVPTLVTMPAGVTFTQISTGWVHILALGSDGETYAWGQNNFGELGDILDRSIPTLVKMP